MSIGSIGKRNGDPLSFPEGDVRLYRVSVLYKIRLYLPALVDEYLLQIRPIDHHGIGQIVQIGTALQRKLNEPIRGRILIEQIIELSFRHTERSVHPQPVLNPAGLGPGKREPLHDTAEQRLVHLLEHGERVGGELDGPAELRESGGLLVDGHVEPLLEHAEGNREAAHAAAGDGDGEGAAGSGGEAEELVVVGHGGRWFRRGFGRHGQRERTCGGVGARGVGGDGSCRSRGWRRDVWKGTHSAVVNAGGERGRQGR